MHIKNLRTIHYHSGLSMCLTIAYAQNGDDKQLSVLPRQYRHRIWSGRDSGREELSGSISTSTGWTTNQQVQNYISVLKEKGPDGLVSAMDKTTDVGRLSPSGFIGSGFRFARYRPTANGGLHIVMVTKPSDVLRQRVYHSGRSVDYQFGMVVLNVDKDGKGTGELAPVCKIKFSKKNEARNRELRAKALSTRKRYISKKWKNGVKDARLRTNDTCIRRVKGDFDFRRTLKTKEKPRSACHMCCKKKREGKDMVRTVKLFASRYCALMTLVCL